MKEPTKKEKHWKKFVHTPTKKEVANEIVCEEDQLKKDNPLCWLGKKWISYLNS
jgi:hypothetical protein